MKQFVLRLRSGLLFTAALLLLAGCGPTTADEFRKTIGGSSSSHIATTYEEFEVARPFKDVTATLRQKTEQCLDKTVHVICTNCIGKRDMGQQTWTPTIIATPKRTEIHLQLKRTDLIEIGSPPGGNYEIVLDATPVDKNRTKIEIYRLRPPTKFIHEAMKQWAKGNTAGCPDLTTTQ
jgi:hypothetical protein